MRPRPGHRFDVKALAEVAICGSSGRWRGAVGGIVVRMPDVRQRV
jgi:hypothetical protein